VAAVEILTTANQQHQVVQAVAQVDTHLSPQHQVRQVLQTKVLQAVVFQVAAAQPQGRHQVAVLAGRELAEFHSQQAQTVVLV
jgi:hypothetical protein